MADFHARYFSQALARSVSFYAYLPLDADRNANPEQFARSPKTLLLLHGYTGDAASWKLDTPIYSLAAKYNLALIMPDGENSFYLDGEATGRQYGTFVGKELPDFAHRAFGLSGKREDQFVAGISMGGFGAVHTGFAYPDAFAKIAAFSPALIERRVAAMRPETAPDGVANYEYYSLMFGQPEALAESRNSPETLVKELVQAGKPLPGLFLTIGTEDFLYEPNQEFRRFLTEQNVPFHYEEGPGTHSGEFWNARLEPAIRWMLDLPEQG